MAETVMAMALHFARGLDFAVRAQHERVWDQEQFATSQSPIVELDGLTMGILGYGGIGSEVARRAHAFGMRVLATRRTTPQSDRYAEVIAGDAAGLDRVLRESDILVIALPATPQTRGLIGATELARMKSNGVLISVSRGTVLREAELADALKRGVIRGAALDVFEHEPLAGSSPLWDLPNVLITPHVSATTPRFWEREADLILDNFDRYLRGAPLRNVVDKIEGY